MADAVAITSVAFSGTVALAGLVLTYRAGREQRSHEETLAFEARAWEQKSAALLRVISVAQRVIDGLSEPEHLYKRSRLAASIGDVEQQ
jgi:hypothetical protein